MTLDPELKAEWITALTSGDYDQGNGKLREITYKDDDDRDDPEIDLDGGNFCCLGVLCDIVAKKGMGEWQIAEGAYGPVWKFIASSGESSNDFIPDRLAEELEIHPNGKIWEDDTDPARDYARLDLSELNDGTYGGTRNDPLNKSDGYLDDSNNLKYTFAEIAQVIEENF